MNLVGIELECRHRRMTGIDALSQGLSKGLDRIA